MFPVLTYSTSDDSDCLEQWNLRERFSDHWKIWEIWGKAYTVSLHEKICGIQPPRQTIVSGIDEFVLDHII